MINTDMKKLIYTDRGLPFGGFSAKGNDLLPLLLPGRASKSFINKQKDKSYGQKTSPEITFIDKLIQFVKRHDDLLSKAMDKDKNSIAPNTLTVKSNKEEDGNTVMKNAADTLVENAEYTLKASLETIIFLINHTVSEEEIGVNEASPLGTVGFFENKQGQKEGIEEQTETNQGSHINFSNKTLQIVNSHFSNTSSILQAINNSTITKTVSTVNSTGILSSANITRANPAATLTRNEETTTNHFNISMAKFQISNFKCQISNEEGNGNE